MKAKFSNLKLHSYFVLKSRFATNFESGDKIKIIKGKLHDKLFDINFDILDSNDINKFIIKLTLDSFSTKEKKKESGYDFLISLRGVFSITDIDIGEDGDLENQYIYYSALPMMISIARSHISMMSNNGIFGTYTLPAIDLPNLIERWAEE